MAGCPLLESTMATCRLNAQLDGMVHLIYKALLHDASSSSSSILGIIKQNQVFLGQN